MFHRHCTCFCLYVVVMGLFTELLVSTPAEASTESSGGRQPLPFDPTWPVHEPPHGTPPG